MGLSHEERQRLRHAVSAAKHQEIAIDRALNPRAYCGACTATQDTYDTRCTTCLQRRRTRRRKARLAEK